jgi:hypothetical protein
MLETVTVQFPAGTLQRMEEVGFPASWEDVLKFLLEEGLAVIEKYRLPKQELN